MEEPFMVLPRCKSRDKSLTSLPHTFQRSLFTVILQDNQVWFFHLINAVELLNLLVKETVCLRDTSARKSWQPVCKGCQQQRGEKLCLRDFQNNLSPCALLVSSHWNQEEWQTSQNCFKGNHQNLRFTCSYNSESYHILQLHKILKANFKLGEKISFY